MLKQFLHNLPEVAFRGCKNYSVELHKFVPKHGPVLESDIRRLEDFILDSNRILIVTGAGISTESGIPDYRSEEVGLYARSNHKPMQYMEFLKSPEARRRYWARNYVGWSTFSKRKPNRVHFAIRDLETIHDKVSSVVTQNVDNLHFKAGSKTVIELHGSAYRVICLECKQMYDRHYIQEKLKKLNPDMADSSSMIRPDGDVEIPQENIQCFKPPLCDSCGGILKPDIIFFGDNVPPERVKAVRDVTFHSDAVLVLGSSLSVFSGYRIILQAVEENKPVAIVNIGPTRADNLVNLKVSAMCGDVLHKISLQET